MKKVLLISLLIVIFAAGSALAWSVPGTGGSDLKKKEKKMTLAEANAALKAYEEGEFAPDPITYIEIGDADFDKFSKTLAKIEVICAFARNVVNDTNTKLDAADSKEELEALKKNVDDATAAVTPLVGEITKLIDQSQKLIDSLKKKLMTNPGLLKEVNDVLNRVKKTADEVKLLTEELGSLVEKINQKIAALV